MTFNEFMWLKTLGRWDGLKIHSDASASLPSETYIKYERNKKIVEDAGVEWGDWKGARHVLRQR